MANKKNLAVAELASSITSSATTATVKTGQGARLPATPFFATLSPVGVLSTPDNSEIISVTAVSTDTLTIVRAQKSTAAKSFAANSIIGNGIYSEDVIITGIENKYRFRAYRNASYTVPTGQAVLVFDTVVYDPNSNFNTSTGQYTAPVAGLYSFSARLSIDANCRTFFDFFINGSGQGRSNDTTSSAPVGTFCTNEVALSAGDTVSVALYTNSSGGLETNNNRAYFYGKYVCPL